MIDEIEEFEDSFSWVECWNCGELTHVGGHEVEVIHGYDNFQRAPLCTLCVFDGVDCIKPNCLLPHFSNHEIPRKYPVQNPESAGPGTNAGGSSLSA